MDEAEFYTDTRASLKTAKDQIWHSVRWIRIFIELWVMQSWILSGMIIFFWYITFCWTETEILLEQVQ